MGARGLITAATLALCGGCIGDLDPKQLVTGPRILDMIADRPEAAPGTEVEMSVVLGGTRGTPRYTWQWCVAGEAARAVSDNQSYAGGSREEGCFGNESRALPLGSGSTATLRIPSELLQALRTLAERSGGRISPETIEILARDIGLLIGFAVTVEVDGVTLRGFKRVVVSSNPRPNTNPPPPRVRMGDRWLSARGPEADGRCVAEDGRPLRLPRGATVVLSPEADDDRWLEEYRVLTAVGRVETRREIAYYSWYATGGNLADQLSRSPLRDSGWTAPSQPGAHTLWMFVRDGHGGSSGCRAEVTVE